MPARSTVSAISFGVFWRFAPSTRLIIRSRNDSPGLAPIRTTMRSERTLVPPVTAERSPPLSRITGADSPVTADSSTDAMPSITSPSPGIDLAHLDHDLVALAQRRGGDALLAPGGELAGHGLLPQPAQRRGLGLAPALGQGLGEVREEDREPQPEGHVPREPRGRGARGAQDQVVQPDEGGEDAPDLDHEHDRVLHHRPRVELAHAVEERGAEEVPFPGGYGAGALVAHGSEHLSGLHEEVLDDRAQAEGGEERQGPDDQDDAHEERGEEGAVRRQACPARAAPTSSRPGSRPRRGRGRSSGTGRSAWSGRGRRCTRACWR